MGDVRLHTMPCHGGGAGGGTLAGRDSWCLVVDMGTEREEDGESELLKVGDHRDCEVGARRGVLWAPSRSSGEALSRLSRITSAARLDRIA